MTESPVALSVVVGGESRKTRVCCIEFQFYFALLNM